MTGSGAYFSYGELRETALSLSIGTTETTDTEAIVARAEAYFSFLTAGGPGDQI